MLKIEPKGTAERIRDLVTRKEGAFFDLTCNGEWIVASYSDPSHEPISVQGGSVSEAVERLCQCVGDL